MRSRLPIDLWAVFIVTIAASVWFAYVISLPNQPHDAAGAALVFFHFITAWGASKLYCARWADIAPRSVVLFVIERAIVPLLVISIATRFHTARFFDTSAGTLLIVLYFLALADIRGAVRRYLSIVAPHSLVEANVYLSYPPKNRLDLIKIDLLFWCVMAIALVRALRWH